MSRGRLELPDGITACLLDLDGVITPTAEIHAQAWKLMFDAFLLERARVSPASPATVAPFDAVGDYQAHVDGRPRLDGVRAFLAARGIALPEGRPGDAPVRDTVHGLAARKNEMVEELLARRGVVPYDGTVRFLHAARDAGVACAVVTSSENATAVLSAAGLADAFAALVDGLVAKEAGLAGKPAPDVFLEAARRLNVAPAHAAVLEDAEAGVMAGRTGGFGLVVGVDRTGHTGGLRAAGADIVVSDLADLLT